MMHSDSSYDDRKYEFEMHRDDAKRIHDFHNSSRTAINDAVIKQGESTIKLMLTINGGACVALLSFIANTKQTTMVESLIWFAIGTVLPVASLAFSYLTNYATIVIYNSCNLIWSHPYIEETNAVRWARATKRVLHSLAILFAGASIITFLWGLYTIYVNMDAITKDHVCLDVTSKITSNTK